MALIVVVFITQINDALYKCFIFAAKSVEVITFSYIYLKWKSFTSSNLLDLPILDPEEIELRGANFPANWL